MSTPVRHRLTMRMLRGMRAALAAADAGGPEEMGLDSSEASADLHLSAREALRWVLDEIDRRTHGQVARR